jgi:hypothetical protein
MRFRVKITFLITALLMVGTAYSMTLTQMRADVRNLIAEQSTSYITTAEIDTWLNQGMYEVSLMACDDLLFELQTSSAITCLAGTTSVTIPSDMVRLVSAYTTTYECTILSPKESLQARLNTGYSTDTTKPLIWIEANAIKLKPALAATTLTLFYIKRPSNLATTTTECSLNRLLHHLIVYYAVSKVAMKIRAFDVSAQYLKLFYDSIQIFNTRMVKKNNLEEGNAGGGGEK